MLTNLDPRKRRLLAARGSYSTMCTSPESYVKVENSADDKFQQHEEVDAGVDRGPRHRNESSTNQIWNFKMHSEMYSYLNLKSRGQLANWISLVLDKQMLEHERK